MDYYKHKVHVFNDTGTILHSLSLQPSNHDEVYGRLLPSWALSCSRSPLCGLFLHHNGSSHVYNYPEKSLMGFARIDTQIEWGVKLSVYKPTHSEDGYHINTEH